MLRATAATAAVSGKEDEAWGVCRMVGREEDGCSNDCLRRLTPTTERCDGGLRNASSSMNKLSCPRVEAVMS